MKKTFLFVLLFSYFLPCIGKAAELRWYPVAGVVEGYKIYARLERESYEDNPPFDVGNVTSQLIVSMADLLPIGRVYFVATAYNSAGESEFSNEVSWDNFDTDGDGLSLAMEEYYGTDPDNPDTDGDGISDGQEDQNNTDPTVPENFDPDNDGLTDSEEAIYGTDPDVADSDGDGINDGDEVAASTNPLFNQSQECHKDWFAHANYFYGIKMLAVSQFPVLNIVNLLDEYAGKPDIIFGQQGDQIEKIENLGDMNGNDCIDVKAWLTSGEEIRDTCTGELVVVSTPSCDWDYRDMKLGKINGQTKLVMYAYCAATNSSHILILDPKTNSDPEKQIEVGTDVPLNLTIIPDQNWDGLEDFYVSINGTSSIIINE